MKQIYKRLGMLLLALAMLATTATFTGVGAAAPLDWSKTCSLTVSDSSLTPESGLVIDLYLIADAVPVDGYDSYAFNARERYADALKAIGDTPTNEDWQALAKTASVLALAGDYKDEPYSRENPIGSKITDLGPGLYLIVPHGGGVPAEEYVEEGTDKNGNTVVNTTFSYGAYNYTFSPALISLPTKPANEDDVINSANPGEWIYDHDVTLKAGQSNRMGTLEIQKTLASYMGGGSATFVFQIEATLPKTKDGHPVRDDDGNEILETVYSDVITITMDDAGTLFVDIQGIPVGATVYVTEVYSGVRFELVGEATQMATIPEEGFASVEFTNEYKETVNSGGGINNMFTYDGQWNLTEAPFGS